LPVNCQSGRAEFAGGLVVLEVRCDAKHGTFPLTPTLPRKGGGRVCAYLGGIVHALCLGGKKYQGIVPISALPAFGRVAADIGAENLLQVTLDAVEELQGLVVGVLAVIAGFGKVVVDPAGERAHLVDAAVALGEVEEGTVSAVVKPLGEQVEDALFIGEDVGTAFAALAGRAPGLALLVVAKGFCKDAPAESVRCSIEKADLTPSVGTRQVGVDDTALQALYLAGNEFFLVGWVDGLGHGSSR
jgi:hypothetical protein